jgi:tRNA threonylcarbamoyladenosine biosynthesis protein TsaB
LLTVAGPVAMAAPPDAGGGQGAVKAPAGDAPVIRHDEATGLVESISAETVGSASELAVPSVGACNVIGSGWATYREVLRERIGEPSWADGGCYPQAVDVARLAFPHVRDGVAPEHALPVYLRDKVALTLSEQRQR